MDYQVLSIEQLVEECAERPTPEAWEEFIRRFNRLIASVALRTLRKYGRATPDLVEEMIQETYLKLCANDCAMLKRFKSKHPNAFLGYLKVVTANLIIDIIRPLPDPKKIVEMTEIIPGPHFEAEAAEREIFFNRIDKILRQRGNGPQEEKERAIFWLYFRQGMTAKEIASIPGMKLTVKGVESCIFRLIVYIRKELFGDRPGGVPGGIPPL
jgi:RNA polymerase sigma-70 factor (ECF subfamily)